MSDSESFSDNDFSASSEDWNPDSKDEDSEDEVFEEIEGEKSTKIRNAKKQTVRTKNIPKSRVSNKKIKSKSLDSDSDSSVDDYLVDPKELNFESEFFKNSNEQKIPSFDDIEKSILSDTNLQENLSHESDTDLQDEKLQKLNFKNIHDFTKNLESVKNSIKNYHAEKPGDSNMDIGELLALGETGKSGQSQIFHSDSDDDDEEEDGSKNRSTPEGIGKDGITITINLPNAQKKGKTREDYRLKVCRRMNLIKKKNQVFIHKVHVLCWIAHGNYVNRILNYPKLLKSALTLIPSNNCYPPDKADLKYLEMILKWFAGKMKYVDASKRKTKEVNNMAAISKLNMKDHSTLVQILDAQIKAANAFSKKTLILIFIILLRALGLQCRLVLSFVTLPLKPNPEDLFSLSKTNDNEKAVKRKHSVERENDKKSIPKIDGKKLVKTDDEIKKNKTAKSEDKTVSDNKNKNKDNVSNKKLNRNNEMKSNKHLDQTSSNSNKSASTSKKASVIEKTPEKIKKSSKSSQRKSIKNDESHTSPAVTRHASKRRLKTEQMISELKIPQLDGANDEISNKKLNIRKIKNLSVKKSETKTPVKPSTSKIHEVSSENKMKSNDKNSSLSESNSPPKRKLLNDSDSEFKPNKKQSKKVNKANSPKDDEKSSPRKRKCNLWAEVYLEAEEKWICVDVASCKLLCVKELYNNATHPITYIVAWNNDLSLKDVTRRYVPKWNTITRKLRAEPEWWDATLKPWLGKKTVRDRQEDEELYRSQLEQPLPASIQEFKNHPLYALKRHLLKFEAIYPPDAPTLGFIKGEPVYARECVHTLHSRDIWLKEAKVVRLGEKPYKIVKSRPKYDKLSGTKLPDAPLEIFGPWQVEDYDPPQAENGIVPRNAYGNVDLFKPCMLPKGTVCLQLPGLLRIARKLEIDCVPAIVGFEFKKGFTVPMYGGFVVCEEFKDTLIAAWDQEEEEAEKKAADKIEKRVYGNWRKLIKALIIREQLKARYNFGNSPDDNKKSSESKDKKKARCQKKK